MDPGPTAIGTWSGGRFMSFGEPLDEARLLALLRPGEGIDTVITADAYGAGEADRALGKALAGVDRQDYCLVGFSAHIDWAMIILNPLEPWPGELALAAARTHEVKLITRVVDYGGLFHDDVLPGHEFGARDHRAFRPAGWVEDGRAKLERM